jgi:hypothetical protein
MKARIPLIGSAILAVFVGACSTDSGQSGSVLLTPQTYGTGLSAFTISFTHTPTTAIPHPGVTVTTPPTTVTTTSNPSRPRQLASRENWFGGNVNVAVITDEAVRPLRIENELRSYLPFATGGRMLLIDGMPAIREVVDCSTPSGQCPGKTAGLEVLDGSTLFDVFTSGLDEGATDQTLSSFHVQHVATTPGCSYQVTRKGFTQRCASSY